MFILLRVMRLHKEGRSLAHKHMSRGFWVSRLKLTGIVCNAKQRFLHTWFTFGWKYFASDGEHMFGDGKIFLLKRNNSGMSSVGGKKK